MSYTKQQEQVRYTSDKSNTETQIILDVFAELKRAREKFPWWPRNIVHAAAVICEESGEILKAANEVHWEQKQGAYEEAQKEAIQTIAMCIRFLTETPRPPEAFAEQRAEPASGSCGD